MSRSVEIALAGLIMETVPRTRGGAMLAIQVGGEGKPLQVFVPEGTEFKPGDRVVCQGFERITATGRPLLEVWHLRRQAPGAPSFYLRRELAACHAPKNV
jgi:hypothetical protein